MNKYLLIMSSVAMVSVAHAEAAPWVRGYVIDYYEPAWHFGGKAGYTKPSAIDPGSDCINGTTHILNYTAVIKTPWRTDADVAAFVNPPNTDLQTIHYLVERGLSYRGFRKDIETFVNPFAAPDPGMSEVTGKIAEGFDLDNNPNTGGFTSPNGERGIDNAYYRAVGCIGSFRGMPYSAAMSVRANDKMLEGLYTIVIRVSGNKDPMNDDDATFEIGYSPDHVMKQVNGRAAANYSFRIVRNTEYTRVKAKVRDGVVETEQGPDLRLPRFSWFPAHAGEALFYKGRVRLVVAADGNASGLIGGYRDWRELYAEDTFSQSGGTVETRDHHDLIGMYYALKRNADGIPDQKTGQNIGISIAYRFRAVPAYVTDSEAPAGVNGPESDMRQVRNYQKMRAAFLEGIASKAIQPVPAGSNEAAPQLRQRADGTWTNSDGERRPILDEVKQPSAPVQASDNSQQLKVTSAASTIGSGSPQR